MGKYALIACHDTCWSLECNLQTLSKRWYQFSCFSGLLPRKISSVLSNGFHRFSVVTAALYNVIGYQ